MNKMGIVVAWLALAISVVVVIGTLALSDRLVDLENGRIPGSAEDSVRPDEIAKLSQRIAALEMRQAPGTGDLSPLKAKIDTLSVRLSDLEERRQPGAVDLSPLRAEIGKLSNRLLRLEQRRAPDGAGSSSLAADIRGLSDRLNNLERRPPAKAVFPMPLVTQMSKLSERLAELERRPPEKFDPSRLEAEIGKLGTRLADLERRAPKTFDPSPLKTEIDKILDQQAKFEKIWSEWPPQRKKPEILGQVYFATGRSDISEPEKEKMRVWAQSLKSSGKRLTVLGFADRVGSPEFNRGLSLQRAAAVRNYFVAQGVEQTILSSIVGLGEDSIPIRTEDGIAEPQNRTVLIYVYE
ncbi:MAG: OmpA family protein [Alphaproteobacteria bacterium]|nr:OmpA family protein [Alphaproteobacteria bacterium]